MNNIMAHYAILNENNIVTQVIVGKDETDIVLDENGNPYNWEVYYGAKKTSYNTYGGVHLLGGTPFRKNYAGIGYTYDESRDAFISPKPYESWLLNEEKCIWESPIPMPNHIEGHIWMWNEELLDWESIKIN
jgi:hypothetical protein